jgi:hypothetical protein
MQTPKRRQSKEPKLACNTLVYVKEGMMRFMTEQYAEALPIGCMLGYVMDGDLPFALAQVKAAIAVVKVPLSLMEGPATLAFAPDIEQFSTGHQRANKTNITLRHTLLPFPSTKATATCSIPA